MPASEAQIRANQANSKRSSGPRSELGKSRSCLNATKHGLAGQSATIEAARSPEFEDRRAKWAAEQNPVGEGGHWALDRAVASSFRIERCERAIDEIFADVQQRASLAWDQDRAVEAARIFGRLAKDPILASRQLQTTWDGVVLLIDAWFGLADAIDRGDWSESEASRALDLLGVDPDLRSGRTPVDAPEGADPFAFLRSLVEREIDRLEHLRDEALAPLDDLDRRRAMAGATALLSKEAKLVLRYERDAWKRYREAMKELKAQAPTPTPTPTPPVAAEPAPPAQEARAASPAEATPIRREVADRPVAMGRVDEARIDPRVESMPGVAISIVPTALPTGASVG